MYFQTTTTEFSLQRPNEALGDAVLSPLFRRVSSRCPVLHLFGYLHLPSTSTAAASATPHSLSAGYLNQPGSTPLDGFRGRTSDDASPPPALWQNGAAAAARPSEASTAVLQAQYTTRRACLHIHGFYASFLVPQYDKAISAAQFGAQVEAVALRRQTSGSSGGGVSCRPMHGATGQQVVHHVEVVRRYSVYGYRPHRYAFYKVEVIDPNMVPALRHILQETTEVGNRRWQLYDAHAKFHSELMVALRINGAGPFYLPLQHCHVRRSPTASVEEFYHLFGPPSNAGSSSTGAPRVWQPDELSCLTDAEVELDVAAKDLRPPSPSVLKPSAAEDNLSYTRQAIQQYFKTHGISDVLRLGNTIEYEEMQLLAQREGRVAVAASSEGFQEPLRYGAVMQLQRSDAAVGWMRRQMQEYLTNRLSAAELSHTQCLTKSQLSRNRELHDQIVLPYIFPGEHRTHIAPVGAPHGNTARERRRYDSFLAPAKGVTESEAVYIGPSVASTPSSSVDFSLTHPISSSAPAPPPLSDLWADSTQKLMSDLVTPLTQVMAEAPLLVSRCSSTTTDSPIASFSAENHDEDPAPLLPSSYSSSSAEENAGSEAAAAGSAPSIKGDGWVTLSSLTLSFPPRVGDGIAFVRSGVRQDSPPFAAGGGRRLQPSTPPPSMVYAACITHVAAHSVRVRWLLHPSEVAVAAEELAVLHLPTSASDETSPAFLCCGELLLSDVEDILPLGVFLPDGATCSPQLVEGEDTATGTKQHPQLSSELTELDRELQLAPLLICYSAEDYEKWCQRSSATRDKIFSPATNVCVVLCRHRFDAVVRRLTPVRPSTSHQCPAAAASVKDFDSGESSSLLAEGSDDSCSRRSGEGKLNGRLAEELEIPAATPKHLATPLLDSSFHSSTGESDGCLLPSTPGEKEEERESWTPSLDVVHAGDISQCREWISGSAPRRPRLYHVGGHVIHRSVAPPQHRAIADASLAFQEMATTTTDAAATAQTAVTWIHQVDSGGDLLPFYHGVDTQVEGQSVSPSYMVVGTSSSSSTSASLVSSPHHRRSTAMQHSFLEQLSSVSRTDGCRLLHWGSHLGKAVDGLPRVFQLRCPATAGGFNAQGDARGRGRPQQNPVHVSAVTWPFMQSPAASGEAGNCYTSSRMSKTREETASGLGTASKDAGARDSIPSDSSPAGGTTPPNNGTRGGPECGSDPAASGEARGSCFAATPATHAPHFYLQCSLRLLYVEVIMRRCAGVQLMDQCEVLAVGLGQATSTSSTISIQLFCVRGGGSRVSFPHRIPAVSAVVPVVVLPSEAALLLEITREIRRYDPDLLLSWEAVKFGFGHLALRYAAVHHRSFAADISRWRHSTPLAAPAAGGDGSMNQISASGEIQAALAGAQGSISLHSSDAGSGEEAEPSPFEQLNHDDSAMSATTAIQQYTRRFGSSFQVAGRLCRSLGRDLRKEVKLPSYSLPMAHQALLGEPLPLFSDLFLTELCGSTATVGEQYTVLRYLATRVAAPHRIASRIGWFRRLLEFSKMYGILPEEVLTRGSQFRVEATLIRVAATHGYAMLSPSLQQVHRQPRMACIPLVMPPRVDYYRDDPIAVLDFRSLYPSIILAYNLCYSTCLGMVQKPTYGRLGVLPAFKQSNAVLAGLLPDDGEGAGGLIFSPNGAMFVTPAVRKGILPLMIRAVLDSRFEVQAALRHVAAPMQDDTMEARLQEQQLALKMLANVTYGYTAASYSGRMPCVDLAEAIVSFGRQTLQRAIAMIHGTPEWRAEVVYGDTDSLFLRLAGRTKAEAFEVGAAIAAAVTASNPPPVRLQMEKVLWPCLLLVKKRYAGCMWTSPSQTTPIFLAKGIEVVRRDQCPLTAQLTERLLRQLFAGATAEELRRSYFAASAPLYRGSLNPLFGVFRRAVKLGRYSKDDATSHLPLGARLTLQQMEQDIAKTPYWGERVPYVIARSPLSDRLRDKVLHPEQLLYVSDTQTLDATYYMEQHVNSTLSRIFSPTGIDIAKWYRAMPQRRETRIQASVLRQPFMRCIQSYHWPAPAGEKQLASRSAAPKTCIVSPLSSLTEAEVFVVDDDNSSSEATPSAAQPTIVEVRGTPTQAPPPRVIEAPRRQITLETYYPQALCINCQSAFVTPAAQQRLFSCITEAMKADGDGATHRSDPPFSMRDIPPICADCLCSPQELLTQVLCRCRALSKRQRLLHGSCLYCMGSGGEAPASPTTALPWTQVASGAMDMEDIVFDAVDGALPGIAGAVPFQLAAAADFSPVDGIPRGCISIDCGVSFEKKRVAVLLAQWRTLEWLLRYLL